MITYTSLTVLGIVLAIYLRIWRKKHKLKRLKEFKPEYFILLAVLFVLISSETLEGRSIEDLTPAALILAVLPGYILKV